MHMVCLTLWKIIFVTGNVFVAFLCLRVKFRETIIDTRRTAIVLRDLDLPGTCCGSVLAGCRACTPLPPIISLTVNWAFVVLALLFILVKRSTEDAIIAHPQRESIAFLATAPRHVALCHVNRTARSSQPLRGHSRVS
jgi:hypothetical protein